MARRSRRRKAANVEPPGRDLVAWRRATKIEIAAPTRRHVVKGFAGKGHGKAIHWPGDAIRRAAFAIREVYSTDFYVMPRRALEAAVRNEDNLHELLPPDTGHHVRFTPTNRRR